MSTPPLSALRNIGIISHIDAGKTTVSERILFLTGEIHRMGEVHEGTATMDWMEQEQERGITITASNTTCRWQDWWINLIDTPGHIDFTIEVERSLRVLDGAVAIFSAVEGVQPQSESVWRQAERYRVPRLCFINKLDRVGADHHAVLAQLRERLGATPVLLQLPLGSEAGFQGVIDLIGGEVLRFGEAEGRLTVIREPLPPELGREFAQAREAVIEAAADFDDAILADAIEGRAVTPARIFAALRRGTLAGRIHPVLLGSALRNKGIQPLLDAIGQFLPSPADIPPVAAHPPAAPDQEMAVTHDPRAPLCALAFKVLSDEGRKLTFLRLYSGEMRPGESLFNARLGTVEKVARLFRMHAHRRERIDLARAGDIVAATGLRDALTGDTLTAPERPLQLAGLTVPEPVVSLAVEAKGLDDRDKLQPALEKLQWEDPTFRVREDPETGQTILTGMGELHLEVLLERLRRDFHVEVHSGRPQVVYRETLRQEVAHHEVFARELDGKLQSGEVRLRLEPGPRGSGLQVVSLLGAEHPAPEPLRAAALASLRQGAEAGVVAGYPLTDLTIALCDLPCDSTTTEAGVRAATQKGLAQAARGGKPTLLEPVMALELTVPGEYAGKVYGSLQQKRGRIEGSESRGGDEIIRALVPLTEMFGYMTELRSATKGRGSFTMEFARYDLAPPATLQRFGL